MIRHLHMRCYALTASLVGVILAGAAPALAQTAPRPADEIVRSAQLAQAAAAMFETPEHWQDAAALLTQAARLRPTGDPNKHEMLATAGRLYAYRGDNKRAIYWIQKGAEQALAGGDVVTAARTFTQAAYLASEQHDWSKVRKLAQRVETLAQSPLLTDDQRAAIRRPFAPATLLAAGQ